MLTLFVTLSLVLLFFLIVVIYRLVDSEKARDKLSDDYYDLDTVNFQLKADKVMLERELTVALRSNKEALQAWRLERNRLWSKIHKNEQHAKDLQEFHLRNEQSLQHELAGAHALIELLMMAVPKGGVITHPFEVRRLFRPVLEAQPKNSKFSGQPAIF